MSDYTDLKARLEECAIEKHQEAWQRPDGGQDLTIGATLATEALAAITALEAARDEAIRRRDTWKAKAEGYDELAAAVRAKVKEEPATMSRILLKAALIDAEKQRAALEADIARLQTAHVQMQRAYDDLAAENARLRDSITLAPAITTR
ncbi:hypothetical protein UFOVP681_58 [uncultured Caudovirales phage]|uniref:Uncharacterized protein n=1 Tax=uncultured Caudovirales phage TaxID=2100421 RepID=A0A6J5NLW7_9CAUD|nr:hypothetical protein UFOVP681_58 [uncultured Caudovirales phage]